MDHPNSPDDDPGWLDQVRQGLMAWYASGHRDMPWRQDRDPYRILLSEIMLVQTTVAAVTPHFERFLARFPTVESLAKASEDEVLKAWEGLGYYRRARQLHAAAHAIVTDHGGRVPDDPEKLLSLPGVGRYIAGAVLSFAYDRSAPILEANTQRVLARLIAWKEDVAKPSSQKRLWQAAECLVPEIDPGQFNQAIMELGATICAARAPRCLACPVASQCRARALGIQDEIPRKTPRPTPLQVIEATAIVTREGRYLVVKRGPNRLWEGFWEFPTIHVSGADPAGRSLVPDISLEQGVLQMTGVKVSTGPIGHTVKFGVTKHRVQLNVHRCADLGGHAIPYSGLTDALFASAEELGAVTMGSAMRKVAKWALSH